MNVPTTTIPIIEIALKKNIKLCIKREDLIHPEISGNKYWKLLYNINSYLDTHPKHPKLITFGGAFSNHIAAVAALGKDISAGTLGIIRGEELLQNFQQNPTLRKAHENGMEFQFVTRNEYRNKEWIVQKLKLQFPDALLIPEGGSNELAVKGIQHMLTPETKEFNYLCSAVGTGGTLAGISKFCEQNQKVVGLKAVNDVSLDEKIFHFSNRNNFTLFDAHEGGYGKITDENVRFINEFYEKYGIPLDPIYTGKMMKKIFELIDDNYFPENSKILAFHTGGLQGNKGANEMLKKQNRDIIKF